MGDVLREIRRVLACQMRGSLTRQEEDTAKFLSPLRREKKIRQTAVVYGFGKLPTPHRTLLPHVITITATRQARAYVKGMGKCGEHLC